MLRTIILAACFVLSHGRNCLLHEIANGKWVYRGNNITRKSFTCCQWDNNDYKNPQIASQCGNKDLPDTSFRFGRQDFPVLVGAHGCVCDATQHTQLTVSEREKYTWVPNDCNLLAWNATAFCQQLGHRKILFVGDSTMGQSAAALMNMIVSDVPKGLCGPQLLVLRLDMPSEPTRELVTQRMYAFAPDFILFNFGAHSSSVERFSKEMEEFLENFVGSYRKNIAPRPVHFIWKTNNPPFPNCSLLSSPAAEPPSMEGTRYAWGMLDEVDVIARNITAKHHFQIMDMYPLKLRGDSHPGMMALDVAAKGGDCLHFCMPGPLDLFSTMVHHMLLQHGHKRRLLR